MPHRREAKKCSPDHDMIEIPGVGYVSYAWLEREAICVESGLSEKEALRVASTDYQRILGEAVKKRHASSSYDEPLKRRLQK